MATTKLVTPLPSVSTHGTYVRVRLADGTYLKLRQREYEAGLTRAACEVRARRQSQREEHP